MSREDHNKYSVQTEWLLVLFGVLIVPQIGDRIGFLPSFVRQIVFDSKGIVTVSCNTNKNDL